MRWREDWKQTEHQYALINPPEHPTYDLYETIDAALEEDAGDLGDITTLSTVPEETQATASFVAKANGVVAGLYVASVVFKRVSPDINMTWMVNDGDTVIVGQTMGVASGPARALLVGERVALNYLQRMSGIATNAAEMVKAIGCCTRATVLDTRKTVPGLRLLDKWAVLIGGAENHRMGLYDMMMIKDNHIAAAGGILKAVDAAEYHLIQVREEKYYYTLQKYMTEKKIARPLEVETRTLDELKQVLKILDSNPTSMITRIMLDNMSKRREDGTVDVSMLNEAVSMIGDREVETEASGNVTLDSIREIAKTGVRYISTGSLTHSVKALDISLNIETDI